MHNPNINQARGRIAWIGLDGLVPKRVASAFANAKYWVNPVNAQSEAEAPQRYDLAIVDLRARRLSAEDALTLTNIARRRATPAGIVFLTRHDADESDRARLARLGEVCILDRNYALLADVCRERLRISKLAEETGERLKTLVTMEKLSNFPSLLASTVPTNILVAGKPTPAALAAINTAAAISVTAKGVFSAGQAMRALDYDTFDCVVFLPENENDVLVSLARALRRHRVHRRLPIITVLNHHDSIEKLDSRAGAEILLSHHIFSELETRINVLTNRARLMAAMRRFLQDPENDVIYDKATKTYSSEFFAKHAARVFARADEMQRPAALIGLRINNFGNDAEARGKQLRQAAVVLNRLLRAEDLTARLTPTTLVFVLSNTAAEDAQKIAQRIQSVISNVIYRSGEKEAVLKTSVASCAIARMKNEQIEETTARLLAALKSSSVDVLSG